MIYIREYQINIFDYISKLCKENINKRQMAKYCLANVESINNVIFEYEIRYSNWQKNILVVKCKVLGHRK